MFIAEYLSFAPMSTYLSARWVYPVNAAPVENGVLCVSDEGTIECLLTGEEARQRNIPVRHYPGGVLVPGMINTHCHLELSHLQGKISEHTGLPGFVQQVIQQRGASSAAITAAMEQADAAMYENGIVAVGDISNQLLSKNVKLHSKLYYHTFIEAMGFDPGRAGAIIAEAEQLKHDFQPLKATIVPHAPYSVSAALFQEICRTSGAEGGMISIHNQETAAENQFFTSKSGHFLQLYKFLGLDIGFFHPSGKSSLRTFLPMLPKGLNTLLVHNTFTSSEDISFALREHQHLYWCLCANANLYIENRLPDTGLLRASGTRLTLGTDSLASNHQLSLLAEMKTLQDHSGIPFEESLRWATLNGASFLGLEHRLGSFEQGKQPGVNLIEGLEEGKITAKTHICRIL